MLTVRSTLQLIFSLFTLTLCGRYLERVWGPLEFLKFCVVTIVVSNAICVAVNVLEHFVLGDGGAFLCVQFSTLHDEVAEEWRETGTG